MRLIICDDNLDFAEHLKNRIMKLSPRHEKDFGKGYDVAITGSIASLSELMEKEGGSADALIMDINLTDGNGIAAAAEFKRLCPELRIVYVTGYDEFSQSVFECPVGTEPVAFILKPVKDRYLENALEKLQNASAKREDVVIDIRHNGMVTYIPCNEIISVCSDKRKLVIHTAEKDVEFYGKLSEFSERLQKNFVQCHKSYIVNIDHMREISGGDSILMSDGTYCPISRKYADSFRTKVIERIGAAV